MATQHGTMDRGSPAATNGSASSVDTAEIAKFEAMADEWWDPKGKFRPLHKFNPTRLGYLRDQLCQHFQRDPTLKRPLAGLRLLDIGCGGGLLSEPMARLGAEVVGADASEKNIRVADIHAARSKLAIDYRATTAEALAAAGETFDVVLNMEVVEHVADPEAFLRTCASLVRPGGLMVVATINRTSKAFVLAIVGAEYVLGWLPRGTHEWRKFVMPDEVIRATTAAGMRRAHLTGVSYNPVFDSWALSGDTAVNYMVSLAKPA